MGTGLIEAAMAYTNPDGSYDYLSMLANLAPTVATLAGGRAAAEGATKSADASAQGYLQGINAMRGAADRGRADVLAGLPVAEGNMLMGQKAAADMLQGSVVPQTNLYNQGSMAAQNTLLSALPMANNAILGQSGGGQMSAFTPTAQALTGQMPDFQRISDAFSPAPQPVLPDNNQTLPPPPVDDVDAQAITDLLNSGGEGVSGEEGAADPGAGGASASDVGAAISAAAPNLDAGTVEKLAGIGASVAAATGNLGVAAVLGVVAKVASFFGVTPEEQAKLDQAAAAQGLSAEEKADLDAMDFNDLAQFGLDPAAPAAAPTSVKASVLEDMDFNLDEYNLNPDQDLDRPQLSALGIDPASVGLGGGYRSGSYWDDYGPAGPAGGGWGDAEDGGYTGT